MEEVILAAIADSIGEDGDDDAVGGPLVAEEFADQPLEDGGECALAAIERCDAYLDC